MIPIDMLILIGTPGSGKTWVGETLAHRLDLRFLDMERMLLSRYGTTGSFVENKPAALMWFESEVRATAADADRTLVFEIGAFSQRPTVERLATDFRTALVLVSADAATRRRRIETRARGRHFVDDAAATMAHDEVFEREVMPTFDVLFEVVNEGLSAESLVELVRAELKRCGRALIGSGD